MAGVKRPFWLHQLAEYVVGGAIVASGLQSPTPAVPAVVGGLVLVHAAVTKGPLAAFGLLGRRTHRVVDVGVLAVEVAAAALPVFDVDLGTRLVLAGLALVHAFVWWQTNYRDKPSRPRRRRGATDQAPPGGARGTVGGTPAGAHDDSAGGSDEGRSTRIGRAAGRAVGTGVNRVRRARGRRGG